MKKLTPRFAAAAVCLALVTSITGISSAGAAPAAAPTADIVDTAVAAGSFTTLVAAAQAAGLVGALKGPGPLTVFAPTDAAFASLLGKLGLTPAQLLANVPLLTTVLTYHVVSGKILSTDLAASQTPTTLAGGQLLVTKSASGVKINGYANVTTADILATNGVIHVVDQVLLPIFVPDPNAAPKIPNIVETAQAAGRFTTLLAAAQAAGLVGALTGPGPLTVFAPTDAAFNTLLRRLRTTPEKLLGNVPMLTKVLKYHVVSGAITTADLRRGRNVVTTLAGNKIVVRKHGGRVTVNRTAVVTTPNIIASNGVIHVINRVLIPR